MASEGRSGGGLFDTGTPASADDRTWLCLATGVAAVVYLSYLLVYPYPAQGAGLYFEMAEQVGAHGYHLPKTIPYYTSGGIPFAYPPLMMYVLAAVRDATGVGPLALARYVPGLVTVAYLVPYYYLARDVLGSRSRAGVAALMLATTPVVLEWHLAAGGVVRSPAFLFTLSGLYAGVELFGNGNRRWLTPAAVLFALTLLTHPVYTTFFGFSYLLLFAYFDRTRRGLLYGVAVAVVGVALAAPWWLQVVSMHGPGIFTAAAGTHDGLGGGVTRLLESFVYPLLPGVDWPFYALAYAGTAYLGATRRWFLPAWLVMTGYLVHQDRFLFVPGAMAASVLLFEVGAPLLERVSRRTTRAQVVSVAVILALTVSLVGAGAVVTGTPDTASLTADTLPAPYMDAQDQRAMVWVTRHTTPSDRFVVLGDAAEWFPLFTHRTNLISPWGVEWKGDARFEHQKALYDSTSACEDADCLTQTLDAEHLHPEYVYVPRGRFTVRREEHVQSAAMRRTLRHSPRYRLVFENAGVAIYRTTTQAATSGWSRQAPNSRRHD